MTVQIMVGDVRKRLAELPDESVHCAVTSPPYWGLRDYGVNGQLGLEPTIDKWVENQVAVFREVRRVLRGDGTCWVNLGDAYAQAGSNTGLKSKDLIGQPWRLVFALQADGWWLRSDIIWHKPNPMPESVTDRPTKSHEYLFLLSKAARYYYDAEAVREAHKEPWRSGSKDDAGVGFCGGGLIGNERANMPREYNPSGRNLRDVWTIPTSPFPGAHFATFPPKLVEPCVKAGTSEKGCCPTCGAPWVREMERTSTGKSYSVGKSKAKNDAGLVTGFSGYDDGSSCPTFKTLAWHPSCDHDAEPVPCTVLDPYGGAGTTALVASRFNRSAILVELNAEYARMAYDRVIADASLLLQGQIELC